MLENNLENSLESNDLIVSLLSDIGLEKENISYRVVSRKNHSSRYILFKKNSNVRDVVEIPSDNLNSIRWNGKFVTRHDFVINYMKDC